MITANARTQSDVSNDVSAWVGRAASRARREKASSASRGQRPSPAHERTTDEGWSWRFDIDIVCKKLDVVSLIGVLSNLWKSFFDWRECEIGANESSL